MGRKHWPVGWPKELSQRLLLGTGSVPSLCPTTLASCFAASFPSQPFCGHVFDFRSPCLSPCLIQAYDFLPGRCHFSTFKQCQEWLSRLSRATARPAKPEDLFAFAYHAWCLGLTEEDQHTHLCQPGEARPFSWGICFFPTVLILLHPDTVGVLGS